MNSFARLIPLLKPLRGKILLSVLFAFLVAGLWGMNIMLVGPLLRVLDEQTIAEYVDKEIDTKHDEAEEHSVLIENLSARLETLSEEPGSEHDAAQIRKKITREQRDLTRALNDAEYYGWAKTYVVPWIPGERFDTFAAILGLVLVATVFKGIFIFLQDVIVGSVVERTVIQLRKNCFRRMMHLDYQTLSLEGKSDLMARFTFDMNVLANGLSLLGGKIVREPLKAGACMVVAFYLNWRLTLLSFIFAPIAVLMFHRFGKLLKKNSKRMMESMSRIYKTLEETLDSMKVVIAFDGARRQNARFHRESKAYYSKAMKLVRIDALTSPSTEILGLFALFVAVLPGAYLVLNDIGSIWGIQLTETTMDLVDLAVLYGALIGVVDPIRKLSSVYAKLKRSAAAADRIYDLLDKETLVKPAENPLPLPPLEQGIEFDSLQFVYATADGDASRRPAALDGVSLTVPAGEVVAVVGDNGSGKSTLVNLLPRFYDPNRGAVRIDGIDIREVSVKDLRAQIGIVTQETLLFDCSIFDNIRYGRPGATEADVMAAAKRAHVLSFVDDLPHGIHTTIGEKGGQLSGGQRQRIAMARALLRDPAILILDEATSAIDAQSEALIHETLREFCAGRTVFIITHSVSQSILDFVTQIVVMEQGRLVAAGPHEELIAECETYQRLYRAQTRQRAA